MKHRCNTLTGADLIEAVFVCDNTWIASRSFWACNWLSVEEGKASWNPEIRFL